MCVILSTSVIFSARAELSCKLDLVGCNTTKGYLISKKIDQENIGLYLNDKLITTIKTDDINEAFAYNDLPHKKNKDKLIEKLLITYNGKDCISNNVTYRCAKFRVIDFDQIEMLSNPFYPPVLNSMLMHIMWGSDKTIMKFKDKSDFTYQDGKVIMSNGGVMAQQEIIDKEKSAKKE